MALMNQEQLKDVMFTNAPRMLPIGLEPECRVMKMIERKWEPKTTERKLPRNYFRVKQRLDRLRIRFGYLAAEEKERYKEMEKFAGPTMSLENPQECWKEPRRTRFEILCEDFTLDPLKYDLAEFNLWQIDNQHR